VVDSKPRILMYSHDSYGLGHLRRTLALAKAFVEYDPDLGVLILTGSTVSGAFRMPRGIDIVKLPSAVKVSNGVYKPGRLPITFEHLRKLRSGLILNTAESFNPEAFIVDKAPLGMKREVSRTLEYLHDKRPSTLTVLGLRDVLDDPDRVRRHWRDNHITEAINRYYDLILVYGPREVYDPLPEYGLPTAILRRSYHVGYVGGGPTLEDTSDTPFAPGYVLVTAGGGGDGFHLIRNYLESLREPAPSFESIVVTGPLMDEESKRMVERLSGGLRARVVEFRADMDRLIQGARAVVTMGGYNTTIELLAALRRPTAERPFQLKRALREVVRWQRDGERSPLGGDDPDPGRAVELREQAPADRTAAAGGKGSARPATLEEIHEATGIDPWFLDQLAELVELELLYQDLDEVTPAAMRRMKRNGFSDRQLAELRGETEAEVRARRWEWEVRPTFNVVDTCGGEFPAATPYYYSSYETEDEVRPSDRKKIVILGSGPNRIGQGIEFDYCCVQAVLALREAGFETIMVNSNPETVSTDFDVADRLYFEPLTLEDVLEILDREPPEGVIVQFGGQTPLKLAKPLEELGVPIFGTSVDAIDRAEDRERFERACAKLDALVPPNGVATSLDQALGVVERVGYPVLVRPSYVLGGRGMEIVYDDDSLRSYFERAVRASPDHPVLIDRFVEDAFEADVDALSDGEDVVIGGIMQHIEDAGVHSGDSACVLPPYRLGPEELDRIRELTRAFALELGVVGLLNVQYAIKDGEVLVLEVNPRASRTIPFVSKATGVPLARLAARVMAGEKLRDLDVPAEARIPGVAVKEAVFPFDRFDVDILLGPEMRSTGEVMGFDDSLGMAYAKAQASARNVLPTDGGTLVVTVNDADKPTVTPILRRFQDLGFRILATRGTHEYISRLGITTDRIFKVGEGRPNIVDAIVSGEVDLLINTPLGKKSQYDDYAMRRAAITYRIPYLTTMSATNAACDAIIALRSVAPKVRSLQERVGRRGEVGAEAATASS
jgi:predicted glycosyltransferase/carbamoylphosphate synthase large subunit